MPARAAVKMIRLINGTPQSFIRGLGTWPVTVWRRTPAPPAMMSAEAALFV